VAISVAAPLLRVTNPATGALVAEVPAVAPADVEPALERARRAQVRWAKLSARERGAWLRRFAGRLLRDPDLVTTLLAETGKPRFEAQAMEVLYTCELTRYYTGRAGRRALADNVRRPFFFPNKRMRVVYHPHGVVGVIGPWNWPLLNNYADCVGPLAAGNAVILKPSPLTPLTSLHVARLWRDEGLPEDVLQVLPGGPEVGQALVDQADMIFFTGSEAVGRRIAARCGERLIPCALELGGKSPLIVLRDADLPTAARMAVWIACLNGGQACARPERILVEEPVADQFIELCREEIARLRHGTEDPASPDVHIDLGAIIFAPQMDRLDRQLQDAIQKGARVVVGGRRRSDLGTQFFEPTLVDHVTPEMQLAQEETFGPVMTIMRVGDENEAVTLANAVGRGLAGSIWSGDATRASELARRIEVGTLSVNSSGVHWFCVESPQGGVKGAGLGVRHGPEGLRQFCRVETIVEDQPILGLASAWIDRQLFMPYKTHILRLLMWLGRRLY
jgi:acyl-CoA reductase-like NAD-dependent aldehyde dehydrogenase